MSPQLRRFLADWLAWATTGAPNEKPFSRHRGLCWNARHNVGWDTETELCDILFREFMDMAYPFNPIEGEYARLNREGKQHLHQPRLDWVLKKLEERA